MTEPPSQGVLKRLAAFAVAFAAGGAPCDALGQLPDSVVEPLFEPGGIEAMDAESRTRLLRLLATHPSERVRERVASSLMENPAPGDHVEAALNTLVGDVDREVSWAATAAFCRHLAQLSPIDALRVVSEWSLAPRTAHRLAAATALATLDAPLSTTALELLANDRSPVVRAAARRALKRRDS